jgi:hypothetical protein
VEKFQSAVSAFFDMIESVTAEVCGGKGKIEWLVEVDHGSAIIRAHNRAEERVSDAIFSGMSLLQAGTREPPKFFNRSAISAAGELGKLVDTDGEYISSLFIKNGAHPLEVSSKTSASADDLLGSKHEELGSVEGKIEIISDRKGFFKCSIFDPLYGRSIVCYFDDPSVEDRAYRAFRKRVLARGLVRYDREGKPVNIVVESIREFPEEAALPTIQQAQEAYG